jgi:hypothetical protein
VEEVGVKGKKAMVRGMRWNFKKMILQSLQGNLGYPFGGSSAFFLSLVYRGKLLDGQPDLVVRPTKEIKDEENDGPNHHFYSCFKRLLWECIFERYSPGTESSFQVGDRYAGRIPLLPAV